MTPAKSEREQIIKSDVLDFLTTLFRKTRYPALIETRITDGDLADDLGPLISTWEEEKPGSKPSDTDIATLADEIAHAIAHDCEHFGDPAVRYVILPSHRTGGESYARLLLRPARIVTQPSP